MKNSSLYNLDGTPKMQFAPHSFRTDSKLLQGIDPTFPTYFPGMPATVMPPSSFSDMKPYNFFDASTWSTPSISPTAAKSAAGSGIMGKIDPMYALDAVKLAYGLAGASKKLPEQETPQEWTDYVSRLHALSNEGLTPEEYAKAKSQIDSAYRSGVANAENLSGGNAGVALSNIAALGGQKMNALGTLAEKDAIVNRTNTEMYGNALVRDVAMKDAIFNRKYNEALQTKTAGAQLASDALTNFINRQEFNKEYGPGSDYAALYAAKKDYAQGELAIMNKILNDPSYSAEQKIQLIAKLDARTPKEALDAANATTETK